MPPKTPDELYAYLDELGIKHETLHHAAVFTAADTIDWKQLDAGLHCKNLFVENKHGEKWLVTMPADDRADMNAIGKQLCGARLSFVKGEHMMPLLGVPPGSATPFAFLNDSARSVRVALDEAVITATRLNVHPLVNTASTVVSGADLIKFLKSLGYTIQVIKAGKVAEAVA
jgi:Ala-tRNA(Pro) deacylase